MLHNLRGLSADNRAFACGGCTRCGGTRSACATRRERNPNEASSKGSGLCEARAGADAIGLPFGVGLSAVWARARGCPGRRGGYRDSAGCGIGSVLRRSARQRAGTRAVDALKRRQVCGGVRVAALPRQCHVPVCGERSPHFATASSAVATTSPIYRSIGQRQLRCAAFPSQRGWVAPGGFHCTAAHSAAMPATTAART